MFVPSTPAALRKEIVAKMLAAPQHVALSALLNGVSSTAWDGPPADVPTLAINKRSPAPEIKPAFRAAFRNLDYREMDGVGHFLMMEKPGEFNRIVIEWVDKTVAAKDSR